MINFAQTATDSITTIPSDPAIDGTAAQPLTTTTIDSTATGGIAVGVLIVSSILAIINLVFFITAIVHLIKNPTVPNRILWVVVSIFVPFGSWIYVLGPRRSFGKHGSVGSQNPLQTAAFSQSQQQPNPIQQQPVQVATPIAPSPPVQPVAPVTTPPVAQPTQPIVQPQQQVQQPPVQTPVFTPEQRQNTRTPQQFDQDFRQPNPVTAPNPAPQDNQQPNQTN